MKTTSLIRFVKSVIAGAVFCFVGNVHAQGFDYIGPDDTATDTNVGYTSTFDDVTSGYWIVAYPYTPSEFEKATELWGVMVASGLTDLSGIDDWRVVIWDDFDDMLDDPENGNVLNQSFTAPDFGSTTLEFGEDASGDPSYEIGFDIDDLSLSPSTTYYIGIYARMDTVAAGGATGVQESSILGGPAVQMSSFLRGDDYRWTDDIASSDYEGTPAYKLEADYIQTFLRADINDDGMVTLSDVVYIIGYLFNGGETPTCMKAADTNDDGVVDIGDAIFLLNYMFLAGDEPPAPFDPAAGSANCGMDLTPDTLTCGARAVMCPMP